MNRLRTKPNRTVGILFVIAIVVVLISGLAPPAGAEDSSENSALKWETGNGGTDIGASGINAADIDGDGTQGIVLDGGHVLVR